MQASIRRHSSHTKHIRDQAQPLCPFTLKGQLYHGFICMNTVCNYFCGDAGIQQGEFRKPTNLPAVLSMNRRHYAKKMCTVRHACSNSNTRLTGIIMSPGNGYTPVCKLSDKLHCTFIFRRNRHIPYYICKLQKFLIIPLFGRQNIFFAMSTFIFFRNKRPLQVQAQNV